ncbi:MAG: hypothetical protein MGG11_15710 [Trichodesmium sp. MAG_R03]|nr:hypothetical protein [Trichodesmium sp. MAG_R03]
MGALVIGNNQNFVRIPHYKFMEQLTYKAELLGIKVIVNEESYTSKASFLDLDNIPTGLTHGHYTRVRANAIRPYIWCFQGEAWVSSA